MADVAVVRRDLVRQVRHWTDAARNLSHLEDVAAPDSWGRLERYLGVSIRDHLRVVTSRLNRQGEALSALLSTAQSATDLAKVRRLLVEYRRQYLRSETTVEFFADAINTRTNPRQGALLRACDILAYRSMSQILDPLGYQTPVSLCYIDKGLGASILKAGLRLWDGGVASAAAAIKVVHHNLLMPTSLVHEAGHQVAHVVSWNDEFASMLAEGLPSPSLGQVWGAWASEIAADAVAFVHTGYGAVLALQNVVAGDADFVFQMLIGDPHPMSYLRVELGIAMCRFAWGRGPWDELADAWHDAYPLSAAPREVGQFIDASLPILPDVARLALATPTKAFRGRALADLVSPDRVSPDTLVALERRLGPALYTSSHWIWTECLRLLALSALRESGVPLAAVTADPMHWMLRLGGVPKAA